jgi:hypothetical protein
MCSSRSRSNDSSKRINQGGDDAMAGRVEEGCGSLSLRQSLRFPSPLKITTKRVVGRLEKNLLAPIPAPRHMAGEKSRGFEVIAMSKGSP